jgi:hypothetical protein
MLTGVFDRLANQGFALVNQLGSAIANAWRTSESLGRQVIAAHTV